MNEPRVGPVATYRSDDGPGVRTVASRCPMCFSRSHVAVTRLKSRSRPFQVVQCRDCGLLRTDPWPILEDQSLLYGEGYAPYRESHKADRPIRRRRWTLKDPYEFAPYGGRRLLDVGCGSGEYLQRMRRLGWTVFGMDMSAAAVRLAHERHDLSVWVDTLPSERLPAAAFDLITGWQVIEHLDRPRQALACLRRALAADGQLALTTPNHAGWSARYFAGDWIGLDLPRHLIHFTPYSLREMLLAEGFQIVRQATVRQSSWIRHSARQSGGKWSQSLLRNGMLSRIVGWLAHARGQGESLHVIARPI